MHASAFAQQAGPKAALLPFELVQQLDLRGHDWNSEPTVSLEGRFTHFAGLHTPNRAATQEMPPPMIAETDLQDPAMRDRLHQGTYTLQILVDAELSPPLGINLQEVLTSYEIWVNGRLSGGNGRIASDESSTVAAVGPKCFVLPTNTDTLYIQIAWSNYAHRHSGIMTPPTIGNLSTLTLQKTTRTILGGILIGLLLMGSLYQFMRYLFRRQEIGFLVNGIWSLMVAVHSLFLHERWLYQLLGEGWWSLCYRLELASLFIVFLASFVFLRVLFQGMRPIWIWWTVIPAHSLALLIALFAPMSLVSRLDLAIPAMLLSVVLVWCLGILDGYRRRIDGWKEIMLATIAIMVAALANRFMLGAHVGSLLPVHYFFSGYIFMFAWILSRRSASTERQLLRLGDELAASNLALEAHNQQLEAQVQERTAELVRAQQATHNLEMEQVQRDLESLSANNQMKVQLSRNLIEELTLILQTGGDYPAALKKLMANLRGQVATEERLGVLQDDFEVVNAEFYRRLQAKHPQLSKTEREICAYIKLNLSGKDIAQLRKTSNNTINVARHRIRKKLGLERDEELEAYVQGI